MGNTDKIKDQLLKENEELHQKVDDLDALFASIALGIIYLDFDGSILTANSAGEDILGLTMEQMMGKNVMDPQWLAFHPDGSLVSGEIRHSAVSLISREPLNNIVTRVFNPREDTHRWINISTIPLCRPGEDKPYRIFMIVRDITERKRIEESLKKSELIFRSLFNQATDSIFLMSPGKDDCIIEDVNEAGCIMHGYDRDDLIGKPISSLDTPETRTHIPERINELMSGKRLYIEGNHVRKDGSTFPVEISSQLVHILNKPYILAFDRDISERKKTEEELNERLKLSELSSDIGIAFTSKQILCDSLKLCAEAIVKHLDALFARIWVFSEEENMLLLQASAGLYTHINGIRSRIPLDNSKVGMIARDRKPVLTNNVIGDPAIVDQKWAKREGVTAFAGYPLIIDDELIGVLALFSRNRLSDITLKALSTIADIISIGILRKQAYEEIKRAKDEWENTFDTMPESVSIIDSQYKIIRVNKACTEQLGVKREQLIGKLCYAFFHGTDEPPSYCPHTKTITEGKEYQEDFKEKTLNCHLSVSTTPIFDTDGKVIASVHIAHDITERKKAEEALIESKERFRWLSEATMDGVAITKNGVFLNVSERFANMFGYEVSEIVGMKLSQFIAPEYNDFVMQQVLIEYDKPYEAVCIKKNGERFHVEVCGKSFNYKGSTARITAIHDINALKEAEEVLRSMSFMDDLTGLYNRRGFLTLAYQQLKIAARDKKKLMLTFADLDKMKWINDALGHPVGDQALKDVSMILKKTFRESDIIARIGGDEFVILAMETPQSNAESLTNRLQQHLDAYNAETNKAYKLSLSLGIAQFNPEKPCSLDELLYKSDTRMYLNKKEKKNKT